ncbi:MAG: hypothetical protein WC516_06990 [Patescibacteria group bacterium]|jgi:hypothetical protein
MTSKIICFDFDGVIAKFDCSECKVCMKNTCKGCDNFGTPIQSTIDVINRLYDEGHIILIWSVRRKSGALERYLHESGVNYHLINSLHYNPAGTSIKPYYDVLVDDRAVGFDENMNLYEEIMKILNKSS